MAAKNLSRRHHGLHYFQAAGVIQKGDRGPLIWILTVMMRHVRFEKMRSRPSPAVRLLVEAELIVHILLRMCDYIMWDVWAGGRRCG